MQYCNRTTLLRLVSDCPWGSETSLLSNVTPESACFRRLLARFHAHMHSSKAQEVLMQSLWVHPGLHSELGSTPASTD